MKQVKRPWSMIMLDNVLAGMNIDYGVETSEKEAQILKKALGKIDGCTVRENSLSLNKAGKNGVSDMSIDLRKDARTTTKEKWYFNVHGNPINHVYGTNVLGFPEADWQVSSIMKRCLKWVEEESKLELPETLYGKVRDGQIFIHNLEFAAYSKKVDGDIQKFIGGWWTMFGISRVQDPGLLHRTIPLDELLGVNSRVDEVEYANTFTVAMNENYAVDTGKLGNNAARYRKQFTAGLRFYDKGAEVEHYAREVDARKMAVVSDRLRVDLQLYNKWFNNRRIKTVADLTNYVDGRHAGDWKKFIVFEINKVVDKACLLYMFNFPSSLFAKDKLAEIPKKWRSEGTIDLEAQLWARKHGINLDVSYKAHRAMMNGRRIRKELLQQYLEETGVELPGNWKKVQGEIMNMLGNKQRIEFDKSEVSR